jgi:hypothetical protein
LERAAQAVLLYLRGRQLWINDGRKAKQHFTREEMDGWLAIIAHAVLVSLLASAMAATLVGRVANKAVSHGGSPVPWILA